MQKYYPITEVSFLQEYPIIVQQNNTLNLNLNSLLVTRQMTLFHQGVRMGEKLVP